jgi:hypothetical protein
METGKHLHKCRDLTDGALQSFFDRVKLGGRGGRVVVDLLFSIGLIGWIDRLPMLAGIFTFPTENELMLREFLPQTAKGAEGGVDEAGGDAIAGLEHANLHADTDCKVLAVDKDKFGHGL